MPLIPFGEYRPDVSDYEGQATRNIRNVIPRGDGYGPFPGLSTYTSALPSACRGAFYAMKSDGTVITFAGTANKLYKLNNTDFSWTDVSKAGGSYIAPTFGGQAANWQFAQFGNLVFATHANTTLQVFDLLSSSAFADCAGSPPQAAYISVVGRFLVLSGLLSNQYRVHWSGLNATTTWDSGVNSSDYQDFPDGGVVRGVAGGEYGIIFQDQAIRRMSYVPGSPLIFQIDRITQDKGLYAPYSIVRAGEKIFFYTGQGFHKIEPGGVPEQIGREKVDRTFLADLDKGNLQLFIGAADPRSTRVYWAYKSVSGAVGTVYDKLLGYDFLLDRFFPVSVTGEYLLGVSQTGLTLENLDSISLSLDALTLSLDAYATAVQPEIGQFNGSHALGFFRGANLEATIESAEQGTDENRITIRGFRPVTDAAAVYGSVSYRDAPSAPGSRRRRSAGQHPDRPLRSDVRHALFAVQGTGPRRIVVDILRRRGARPDDGRHAMTAYVPGIVETDLKKFVLALQNLAAGRSNAVGSVTLATGSATTTVTTANCAQGSTPILTPVSASAATEMGNGTMYVSVVANGSFTITHANSAIAGRTFLYAILG